MQRRYQTALISAVLVAAGGAYAAKDAIKPKAQALAEAKISLVQAVDLAEKATHAKAIEAEFEHDLQGASYEVKLLGGGKRLNARSARPACPRAPATCCGGGGRLHCRRRHCGTAR